MKRPVKHPMLVLALAGILLSTLMAIAATKPAGLWLLAYIGTFSLIGWAAFDGARFIVAWFGRRSAR